MQWLLEHERAQHARDMALCADTVDSLEIDLGIAQGIIARTQPESRPAPVWAALGSKTAVFIYGTVAGSWLTIQVMEAVN